MFTAFESNQVIYIGFLILISEECLAILGGHGAGKSSLLNMLAGNLVMTRGSAYVDGHHIRKNRMKVILY